VAGEISAFVAKSGPDTGDEFAREFTTLGAALADVQAMVAALVGYTMGSPADPRSVYKVGEHAVTLLMSVGDLLIGYLLLRQALVAAAALPSASGTDIEFYIGKVAVARWFTRTVLPELTTRRAVVESADLSLMDVPEAAF